MSRRLSWATDGADWPHRDSSRFVDAAGLRWHVQLMGQGPVALLLHGTGAATHSWRRLAPLLAEYLTVVAPDLPGHGFTAAPPDARMSLNGMAQDIAALCKAMEIEPVVAIGHSAGAAILARMALDGLIAPKLIVSLNGAFVPFGGAAWQFFSPLAKVLTLNPFVTHLFAWRGSDPRAVRRLLDATGSQIDADGARLYGKLIANEPHVAAALAMMANWNLHPLLRDLPGLKSDLLLITGSNDRAIPPADAERLRSLVPGATLESLPGLGHLAHEESPEKIAKLIFDAARASGLIATQQEIVSSY